MRAANQRLGNCSMFAFGGNSNSKPGASTPTTTGAGPSAAATGSGLPITDVSPPNLDWKYSLLRIAIGGSGGGALAAGAFPAGAAGGAAWGVPSESSKFLPAIIEPPIIWKKLVDTAATRTRSGVPSKAGSVARNVLTAAKSSKLFLAPLRRSRKSA